VKTCFKCKQTKSVNDFYRHPGMGDGRLGKCKECTKSDVKKNRANKAERYREYDRMRYLRDKWRKDAATKWQKDNPGEAAEAGRRWAERNREKRSAHHVVSNAVRDGMLTRGPCEICGTNIGVQAHHEDYSRPLDVVWLCHVHHGERHREINEDRRRSAAS